MSAQADTVPPTECRVLVQVGLALEFVTLVTQREHTSLRLQKYFSAKGGNEAEFTQHMQEKKKEEGEREGREKCLPTPL